MDNLVVQNFTFASEVALLVFLAVALFLLKNRRSGWPLLLTTVFFFLNGYLQFFVAKTDRTKSMTVLVASIGRVPAFAFGLTIFLVLLWVAWRVQPDTRTKRAMMTEPSST